MKENRWPCPVVVCDHCRREIADATEASVLYRLDPACQPVDEPLTFVHRDCDPPFVRAHPGEWRWQPLTAAMIYLANGLHLDHDRARETAEYMAAS